MSTSPPLREPLFASEVELHTASMGDPAMWSAFPGGKAEVARFVLGSRGEAHAPQAWIARQGPGSITGRHHHSAHLLSIVLAGSYAAEGKEYGPGSVTVFPAGLDFGPVTYGPEGATLIEFFSDSSGVAPVFEEPPSQEMVRLLASLGMAPPITATPE